MPKLPRRGTHGMCEPLLSTPSSLSLRLLCRSCWFQSWSRARQTWTCRGLVLHLLRVLTGSARSLLLAFAVSVQSLALTSPDRAFGCGRSARVSRKSVVSPWLLIMYDDETPASLLASLSSEVSRLGSERVVGVETLPEQFSIEEFIL